MAIRLIDAMDSMSNGGYIDLLQDRYIPPKWFSEQCEENNTGFVAEDYNEFENNPDRYLKPPIVRGTAIWGITAMRMGVTQEQLSRIGMDQDEYWDIFRSRQTGDNEHFCYRKTQAEKDVIKSIERFMWTHERYNEFMIKKNEILCEIVADWMQKHEVSVV